MPSRLIKHDLIDLRALSGVVLSAPPFNFRVRACAGPLGKAFFAAYADFERSDDSAFVDFELKIRPVRGLRRFVRPLISLEIDGSEPFDPLPAAQAFPLLEWGMNWCVTSSANQYLMCHSAVLAKRDLAVMLPAPPGSGKSTLCAALMLSGWRLLSDELALIELHSGKLVPFVRPVSLKNASISLIRDRYQSAFLTVPVVDTLKGTVAHLRPTKTSVDLARIEAFPRLLVFPSYISGAQLDVQKLGHAAATVEIAKNAFNLTPLGVLGFESLCRVVERCDCFVLRYGRLDEALAWFDLMQNQLLAKHYAG